MDRLVLVCFALVSIQAAFQFSHDFAVMDSAPCFGFYDGKVR